MQCEYFIEEGKRFDATTRQCSREAKRRITYAPYGTASGRIASLNYCNQHANSSAPIITLKDESLAQGE